MFGRRIISGVVAALVVLLVGVSVWGFAAAQDVSAQPFLGIGLQAADKGVTVEQVLAGSPADKAGLQIGDVITAIDGKDVTADSIHSILDSYSVGQSINLNILRGDKTMDLSVTLGAAPQQTPQTQPQRAERPMLGVSLQDSDKGVVIGEVIAGSPAEKAGLKVNDIITKIGDTDIHTTADAVTAVRALKVGDTVSIEISRDGKSQTVQATLVAGTEQNFPFGQGQFNNGFAITYNGSDQSWTIQNLPQDSALYTAGLRAGDVIKTFDGKTYDPGTLLDYLRGLDSSKEITLNVERSGSSQDIKVTAAALQNLTAFSLGQNGPFVFPFGQDDGQLPFFGSGARLGVQFVTLDAQEAKDHNVTQTEGALITDVQQDTPAAKAGLKVNDIVTAVDGDQVDQEHTLRDRLFAYEPGDTIKLDVLRDGKTSQISVTLDQVQFGSNELPFFNFGQGQGFPFVPQGQQPAQQSPRPNL